MMLIFKGKNRVTSGFELPERPDHHGLDIVGDESRDVLSPADGIVRSSTKINDRSNTTWEWGNYVRVDDKDGNRLFFCHLVERTVTVGQRVKKGDKLGVMGNTGLSYGAHTHFEVRKPDGKTRLNPASYLGIPNARGTYTANTDGWRQEGGNWYYEKGGKRIKSDWLFKDHFWYRFGADGRMLTGLTTVGSKRYYLNESHRGNIPKGAQIITDQHGAVSF